MYGRCRRTFFDDLRSPPRSYETGIFRTRRESFFLKPGVTHHSRYQRHSISVLDSYAVFEAMLTGPLSNSTGEIQLAPIYFPTLVAQFDDNAHWAGADDSPLAFGHIGNLHNLAINQSSDCPDSHRIGDPVDIPTERRLPMVDILRRAKHFEIEPGPPLAEHIDCIALVKIDSPRGSF